MRTWNGTFVASELAMIDAEWCECWEASGPAASVAGREPTAVADQPNETRPRLRTQKEVLGATR